MWVEYRCDSKSSNNDRKETPHATSRGISMRLLGVRYETLIFGRETRRSSICKQAIKKSDSHPQRGRQTE